MLRYFEVKFRMKATVSPVPIAQRQWNRLILRLPAQKILACVYRMGQRYGFASGRFLGQSEGRHQRNISTADLFHLSGS